ncbi:hypothetical protein H4Q26_013073 [Puccinia striiformis f. sp. tritici PST-130]|nr:hypothetical protein H4Q26_013073 [Puccinia striiformis f. sp. tritici PST-130]
MPLLPCPNACPYSDQNPPGPQIHSPILFKHEFTSTISRSWLLFQPSSSRPNVAFPLYATQVSATALVWDEVNQVRSEAIRPSISSNHPFEKDTPMNVDEPGKIHPPIGVHNSFVEASMLDSHGPEATEPFQEPVNFRLGPAAITDCVKRVETASGAPKSLLWDNHRCALGGRDRHATLPIAMIPPHPPTIQPVKALRIMRGSSDLIQRHSKWLELYKFLIGAMYEIHQELMNRLNSPPIIGSFFAPTKSWWEDNQFGVTQLELINYFGQDDKDKEHTRLYPTSYALDWTDPSSNTKFHDSHLLATRLANIFGGKSGDYPPSSDPDLNTPRQILSSPEFRIYGLKTVHPRLPVSMNVLDKPGLGLLQVMRHDETISPVRLEDFRLRLLRLIQAMDYFNLLVREKLKIPQTQAATESDGQHAAPWEEEEQGLRTRMESLK